LNSSASFPCYIAYNCSDINGLGDQNQIATSYTERTDDDEIQVTKTSRGLNS